MTNPQLRNFPAIYAGRAVWVLMAVGVWQSAAQDTISSARLPLPAGLRGPFASVLSGNKSVIVGSRDGDLLAAIYSDTEAVEATLGPGSAAQVLEVSQGIVALGWNENCVRLAVVSWKGDVIAVKSMSVSPLSAPSMALLSIDRLVVVWTSYSDGDGTGVSACLLSLLLDPVRCGFRVNAFTQGNQGSACAAPRGSGFVAVWVSAGARDGLFMQEFDADGFRLGQETPVSLLPGFEKCAFPSHSLLLAMRKPSPAEFSELYFQSVSATLTKLTWIGRLGDLTLGPAALLEDGSVLIATNTHLWAEGLHRTAISRVRADGCIYWSQGLGVGSPNDFQATALTADTANSATLLMIGSDEGVVAQCEWPPQQDCSGQTAAFPAWTKAALPANKRQWPLLAVIIPLAAAGLCVVLLGVVAWTWVLRRGRQPRLPPTHLPANSSVKSMDSISLHHGAPLATDIILDIQVTEASPVKFPMPAIGRDD